MRRTRVGRVLVATTALAVLAACGSSEQDEASSDGGSAAAADDGGGAGGDDPGETEGEAEDDGEDGEDDAEQIGELPDSYEFTPNPERVPQDAVAARELTSNAQLTPDEWQPGMVEHDPYENAGTWSAIDEECVWSRGELPDHVLDSLTRRIDVPAADGKGLVQTTVTISVHRTEQDAENEMADILQESFHCPDQDLGGGEQLTGLMALPFAEEEVLNADESMFEAGGYTGPGSAEPQEFIWSASRIGPVTASVSVKGAEGYEMVDLLTLAAEGAALALYRIELELT